MKAKTWQDTVMNKEQVVSKLLELFTDAIAGKIPIDMSPEEAIARGIRKEIEAQSEISFKAGREEEYKRWIKFGMMAGLLLSQPQQLKRIIPQIKGEEHKAGIREVVEFSNDICILHGDADARVRQGKVLRKGHCYECWQAQLKKWEIKQ